MLDYNYNILLGGVGIYCYFCVQLQILIVVSGWRIFEGYIQGIGDNYNNFCINIFYVCFMFIVNYLGGNGIVEVDEFCFYEVIECGDLVDFGFEIIQGV